MTWPRPVGEVAGLAITSLARKVIMTLVYSRRMSSAVSIATPSRGCTK